MLADEHAHLLAAKVTVFLIECPAGHEQIGMLGKLGVLIDLWPLQNLSE
jgi:hypothetical protein